MRKGRYSDQSLLERYSPDMPESLRAHIKEGWSPPLWARKNNMGVDFFDDLCQLVPEMSEIRREYRTRHAGKSRFEK